MDEKEYIKKVMELDIEKKELEWLKSEYEKLKVNKDGIRQRV